MKEIPVFLALPILIFLVPRHLDGLELPFIREPRIARKALESEDPFVHIREADRQRIYFGIFFRQPDSNFLRIVPIERLRHSFPRLPQPMR